MVKVPQRISSGDADRAMDDLGGVRVSKADWRGGGGKGFDEDCRENDGMTGGAGAGCGYCAYGHVGWTINDVYDEPWSACGGW